MVLSQSVWLKAMFSDEPFRTLLATSQNREVASDEKQDVYNGEIWKEFLENPLDTSVPFLSNQNNIGLMLNVDWFKPFKRSEYKVAALMMTVLNLPRAERFKERWTMVLGIIPGPTEPKGNINTFLKPLEDDLLLLWDGLPLHPEGKTVKAALIALSADIPALRKVSQFVSHKADYGCSRCKFKAEREPSMRGSSGNMSYLTSIMAPNRTKETTSQSEEYLLAKSKTEALSIQKKNGVRYSELIRLPYFDIVRMSITTLCTHSYWVWHTTKSNCAFLLYLKLQFQDRFKNVKVPYDVTGIKDEDDLPGMTAQQCKNFLCIYARPCFAGLLPVSQYQCLCLLCEIVDIIIMPSLLQDDICMLYTKLHQHHKLFEKV